MRAQEFKRRKRKTDVIIIRYLMMRKLDADIPVDISA
jgi:hypothetical protein